ncbi:hypothetical protein L6452_10216 [Arctium lappa]|uniref:Uncharacterized protein n=1 Tax=Arctium lappa TaxID=4217 RepID=A0ACB9DLV2_ARCLA|nr:hypothetical protein L6452_10216 [Arctium lappa]
MAPNMNQFELDFKRADLDQDGRFDPFVADLLFPSFKPLAYLHQFSLSVSVLLMFEFLVVHAIWTHADQNQTGYLGRAEFYIALKLVTVAQSKRDLTSDVVKRALYGPASTKIPAPQINLGALPVTQSSFNAGSPALQMHGSAPAASNSMGIRGPQGYSSRQSQDMSPHVTLLPNSTLQPQHGVIHGLPSVDTVLTSHPPSSNLSNDWLGERIGGPPPGASSQISNSGINPSSSPSSIGPIKGGGLLRVEEY